MTNQAQEYWLSNPDPMIAVSKLIEGHVTWMDSTSNPVIQSWVRNLGSYYSNVLEPSYWNTSLNYDGEQGELIKMVVPQARSLIGQLVTLSTKQKLSFQCVAQSQGSDVMQEVKLGNALADQIVDDQCVDQKQSIGCEIGLVMGMAFFKTTWRTDFGEQYIATPEGSMLYSGGVDMSIYTPMDVYFDYTKTDWKQQDWVEVRTIKNRWSLMAQHPDIADQIRKLSSVKSESRFGGLSVDRVSDDDSVFVYELYAKPTPALPSGRMIVYSDKDTIFYDGENKYGCIPVEPFIPEPMIGTGFGSPIFSSLLPCQEMLDHEFSAIATNHGAMAVQSVVVPRNAGLDVQDIGGMNFISYTPQNVPGGGKPESLQLTNTSPEVFKFADLLMTHMQQLSNISPALRGAPPPGVTSGVAIATVSSNSLEFISSISKALSATVEKSVMHGINAYRKFADVPQLVRLVGKNFQAYSKEFVGSDLDPIQSIKITATNPLMQTTAGRADIAEKLVQSGLIKTVQDYISIIDGAPLKQLYETELSENDLIQSENESLMDGEPVVALATDDHATHIRKHSTLLNDPKMRMKNQNVQSILNHIMEHYELAQSTDPVLQGMVRTGKIPEGGFMLPQAPTLPGGEGQPQSPGQATEQPAAPAQDLLGRGVS